MLIRLNLVVEGWAEFSRVVAILDNAVMLEESIKRKIILDLKNVLEFEIRRHFAGYF